jgi:hypothetical protein
LQSGATDVDGGDPHSVMFTLCINHWGQGSVLFVAFFLHLSKQVTEMESGLFIVLGAIEVIFFLDQNRGWPC